MILAERAPGHRLAGVCKETQTAIFSIKADETIAVVVPKLD